jgi:glucose/arabinose dehydrogenase
MKRRSAQIRAFALVLLISACGRNGEDGTATSTPTPIPSATLPVLQAELAFPILSFSNPVLITNAKDGTDRLFVVELAGRILVFPNDDNVTDASVFLDMQDQVLTGGEQGLLGLAFDPDYRTNGFFYVYYSIETPHRSRISRFRVSAGNADQADKSSETVLLEIDQPNFSNHKAGMIAFGPDGKLYIATGDGGGANDADDNAQNFGVLLGKILRINPDGSIPNDNPFVSQPDARAEIWALGLRNPFRMSFDRATGTLWVGDVGQSAREEVDVIVKGGNYGWRIYEGTLSNINPMGQPLSDFVAPVLDYGRDLGQTVIGGYVYRGNAMPAYVGAYLYGDFGSARIWALFYDAQHRAVSNTEVASVNSITSFGEDEAGELYATSFDGKIRRFRQM